MSNVFFFELRDANTDNFTTLYDEKYLLWDKKHSEISIDDYCIVYYQKKHLLLSSKVVEDQIVPINQDGKWFVEYDSKRYYFQNSDKYEEFVAFEIINKYTTDPDFKINMQEGMTLLTQESQTEFKDNLPKLLQIIEDKEIVKNLNRYTKTTIPDAVIKALQSLKEGSIEEILEEIQKSKTYYFGTVNPQNVIKIQVERHTEGTSRSDQSSKLLFYKKDGKYGLLSNTKKGSEPLKLLTSKRQIVLYGPPGTGKTYHTKQIAVEISPNEEGSVLLLNQDEINQMYDELKEKGQIEFITFHPSYSYEEFVEGITVDVEKSGKPTNELKYKLKKGIFKQMAIFALAGALDPDQERGLKEASFGTLLKNYRKQMKEETNDLDIKEKASKIQEWWEDAPRYVLIIDEINRGDISKIFGELITLLESDKRLGMENELTVKLPYSQEKFAVPPNLYVVGTMNTADKSIALIDVALRRRFGFIEMSPDLDILTAEHIEKNKEFLQSKYVYDGLMKSVQAIKKINGNISSDPSVGRDRQIGHSFLFKVQDQSDLILVWQNEILPLLEEYYYGQYDRINTILFKEGYKNGWISQMDGISNFEDYNDLLAFLDAVKYDNK